jgi:hypothetical protein
MSSNTWTTNDLLEQLHRAKTNGLYQDLAQAAVAHGLTPSLVLAVASRETNITNERGDGGHGYGPMQEDDRSHGIPGDWQTDPRTIIDTCCGILAGYIAWAKRQYPALDENKIGCSAYNAGPGRAAFGVARGDCDLRTTGGDYGRDVLARAAVFEKLLGGV